MPQNDAPGPRQGGATRCVGTMRGPCRDLTGTTRGSAPYLSPILSWSPVFSLGTQATSQCLTCPPWHRHRMGQAPGAQLRVRGLFPTFPPRLYAVLGSLPLRTPGRAPKPSPTPPTHILAAEARFAIIARFALRGSRSSERHPPPMVLPPPSTSSHGSPGPPAAPGCREG